jgi:transcriptional regulator with XRE-family HTH domain
MDVKERVGQNTQRLRRSKKLSQEELADRARIHQTYLSGVERGRRNPSILVLDRIARALGVDVEDLVRRRS